MHRILPRPPASGAAEDLRTASGGALAEARRELADRGASGAVAIHEFRKAMKRWRAMLRLFEPLLGDEASRLRIEARDLARELAGTRNVRAALDALNDLGDEQLSERIRTTLRDRLEALGSTAEAAALTDDLRARLDEALDHATGAVERGPLDQVGCAPGVAGLPVS